MAGRSVAGRWNRGRRRSVSLFGDRRNPIRLLVSGGLHQSQTVVAGPRRDQMQRAQPLPLPRRTPQSLAVEGAQPGVVQRLRRLQQTRRELFPVEQSEHTTKSHGGVSKGRPTTPAACSRTIRGRSSRRPRRPRSESKSTRCRTTDARTRSARAGHADPRTSLAPATNPVTSPSLTAVPHSQRVHQHNAALRRQNATAQDTNATIERLPAVRSHPIELFRMLRNLTPKLRGYPKS